MNYQEKKTLKSFQILTLIINYLLINDVLSMNYH